MERSLHGTTGYGVLSLAEVDTPADYVVILENSRAMNVMNLHAPDLNFARNNWSGASSKYAEAFTRHNGGSVATMADGHAAWLRFPDRGLPQPVADLGQLGDCKEGTPLWGSLSARYKAYYRRFSSPEKGF